MQKLHTCLCFMCLNGLASNQQLYNIFKCEFDKLLNDDLVEVTHLNKQTQTQCTFVFCKKCMIKLIGV